MLSRELSNIETLHPANLGKAFFPIHHRPNFAPRHHLHTHFV